MASLDDDPESPIDLAQASEVSGESYPDLNAVFSPCCVATTGARRSPLPAPT